MTSTWIKQLGWLIAIWTASVMALAVVAALMRWWLRH